MTVLVFDPLRAGIESTSAAAAAELDRSAELGTLTPELVLALERFASVLELCEREAARVGLVPRVE